LVDDERALGNAVKRFLQREHDIVFLESAREARNRLLAGEQFDVVLCDLIMPEMTGMELFAEIRAGRPQIAAKMIFLTGGAFTPRAREFLQSVKNPVLEKPLDLDLLRRHIAQMIEG
jgi:CheY-like chemotaxis protein